MSRADPAARAALAAYDGAPRSARLHVGLRWRTCPFPLVAAALPPAGPVLEVGCGHGLFSTYVAAGSTRPVRGIDVDAGKVDVARGAARRLVGSHPGVDLAFEVAPPGALPGGPWAAVVLIDVLYLLDPAAQRGLLTASADALAPGGALVVKEMAPTPRAKATWNRVQEALSVKVLGLTAAARGRRTRFWFTPPDTLAGWLTGAGLDVHDRPLHHRRPHPHHLVVGCRPGDPAPDRVPRPAAPPPGPPAGR